MRWISFVNSIPHANIFHHPAWINLMAECYGYRPLIVALCDNNSEIQSGLPIMEVKSCITGHRWISLPFTDHCMPLSLDETSAMELFEHLSELRLKYDLPCVEIRSAIQNNNQGYRDIHQVLHTQALSTDVNEIYMNFNRNVKRSISKAEKGEVRIRRAEGQHDLEIFYYLHWKTRHRLGVPIQPKRFFRLLWQYIINAGLGFILLAYKDKVPIAGGVFLTYKTTLVHKYSASDIDYWQYCPNHALYWSSIRWGCENGYQLLDWGKTNISNTSLRSFKNQWGAQEVPLAYTIISNPMTNHLTDRLSGIMGGFIRCLPKWVCRMIGELLYKHLA
jgi:lipid II:glycine glycyltransferase (peptidoglycan interpeptide bridge formation enzyme)